jgi:hypothetical protein
MPKKQSWAKKTSTEVHMAKTVFTVNISTQLQEFVAGGSGRSGADIDKLIFFTGVVTL